MIFKGFIFLRIIIVVVITSISAYLFLKEDWNVYAFLFYVLLIGLYACPYAYSFKNTTHLMRAALLQLIISILLLSIPSILYYREITYPPLATPTSHVQGIGKEWGGIFAISLIIFVPLIISDLLIACIFYYKTKKASSQNKKV